MMLPSGNDASHCLAKFFGNLLIKSDPNIRKIRGKEARSTDTSDDDDEVETPCNLDR